MTNITLNRKELEKHFKIDEQILEKISLFGTPLESVSDDEIEIEVFPNRPDLISMHGFIRGFKAFLGKETGLKEYKLNKPEKNYDVYVESEVKDIRPYTACAIIKNLSLSDAKIKEIIDMQEKLHITIGRNRKKAAIGIYPLEKIKLPITYTAKKPAEIKFQPLESQKELTGKQILERHPTGKKYSYLLKNSKKFPVFIDSNKKILSMPPVINSHETGKITEQTKDVFIECSGSDLNTLKKTLNIIAVSLADMGGEIYQMRILDKQKITTPDLSTEKMKISLNNINKLLGLNLKEKDLQKLLPKMGYNYKNSVVEIPAWRTDILHEVDIIEDVAIAYGYDNIIPEIPKVSTIAEESKESKISSKISEILTGINSTEISSYHLIKQDEVKLMKLKETIELESSKTDYKILRPNLLIPALRILSENIDVEYPQKIFEVGRVFSKDSSKETGIKEMDNLILAITPANFTEAKQNLDYLMRMLNIKYKIEETTHHPLIEGRAGKIILADKNIQIGYIGEVHPISLKDWGLKMPVAVFEISLDEIYNLL